MIDVNYQKRKNPDLFKSLEKPEVMNLSKIQNYIPIYNRFFTLNDTNYNNINLNHKWYISSINTQKKNEDEENKNLYSCNVKNINTLKTKEKKIFFKLAPLLDPYKYLIGKYNIEDPKLFNLPIFNSDKTNTYPKILDVNNSAYVDGFFVFLTSQLMYENNFFHGIDYYGSFLAIKNNFVINVFDDIDYLNNSEFFNKNKNILFKIEDYEHLFNNNSDKLKPIVIHNSSVKTINSIMSFNDEIFENIFDSNIQISESKHGDLNFSDELVEITKLNNDFDQNITLKSGSTCSSRTSHTSNSNNSKDNNINDDDEDINDNDINDDDEDINDNDTNDSNNSISDSEDTDGSDDFEEERIDATIHKFPVQIICMEYCENTLDDLILSNDLTNEEWYSILMQIIMILITYQKAFHFTHNDLHTNNVMYNETSKKFIYYCYKNKHYKVPTFGKIFKIIDFGRSIYKVNGKLFCSDSFQNGEDAASQYNTEPYFNEKKPRLEPNFSFDLCRLACSIFDYVIDSLDEVKDLNKCDPIKRLIYEWCLDDKGINLLYKNNGTDRYPDFKLYKMIARCVHNHTPQAQLERPEFNRFSDFKGEVSADVINIDEISVFV
jgi:hypothetical protein